MFLGFNTNVPYNGNIYHIQTEDKGLKDPLVISHIYLKGKIIASRKTSYANIVGEPDYQERVRGLMVKQHIRMIRELLAGKYTEEGGPFSK